MSSPLSLPKSIKTRLAPTLRADGFSGSGQTFYRQNPEMIWIVNVQGSRAGGSFCVNLGLHPMALPTVLGAEPNPRKLTEADCEFRGRLTATGSDQWWTYHDQTSLDAALDDVCALYLSVGRDVFATHSGPASPLLTLTPEAFSAGAYELKGLRTTEVRMAYVLARLRQTSGASDDAAAFARLALDKMIPGSWMRPELEAIAGQPKA